MIESVTNSATANVSAEPTTTPKRTNVNLVLTTVSSAKTATLVKFVTKTTR